MIVVDKLCYRSRLRYVNGGEKFAYSIITLLFCVISRSFVVAGIVMLANGILTVKIGRISLKQYIKMLLLPTVFLILSTLAIIVNISPTPFDAYAILLGNYYLTGSKASIIFGLRLMATALSSVSCLYFLSLNTTMTDILGVLRKLRCPELLMELMLLIYRFVFVLLETASAILIAQKARLGNRSLKISLNAFGLMGAGLLMRAFQRANALYDAMESRCYNNRIQVLTEEYPAKTGEIAAIVAFELILAGITVWRIYL